LEIENLKKVKVSECALTRYSNGRFAAGRKQEVKHIALWV